MSTNPLDHLRGARIAHLIESDGPGGAEQTLINLATCFNAVDCVNVAVVPAHGEGWLGRELAARGITVEPFELHRPVSPKTAGWLLATLRRHKITIAHSHEFTMAVYGAWAARRAGIPHVVTMHGSRYYAERLRRRVALRMAIAFSGQLVAVSRQLATQLSRDLYVARSDIEIIPNGVPHMPARSSGLRDELGLSPTDRLLLAIGNLYPVKGHRYLIDALGLILKDHPRVHVAIAGRGEQSDTLRARAQQLGLADHIHFLGFRSDVPDVLAAADVFVLPSLSEGLPLALLEAMFAGRPIVATDVGDVRSVLDGGAAGLLVESANAAALARALDRVLTNADEARVLGERAAQRAAAEYHVSRMVARYALIYRRILSPAVR